MGKKNESENLEQEVDKQLVETENVPKTDPVEQLTADLQEANDKYLRLYSEFDNFRKRSLKERLELLKTASESVILSILPILDDFERALPAISDETIKSGIELIYNKLKTTLENQGLKVMETIGIAFDADLHEAIAQMPNKDETQKGLIIDEIQRGYQLNEKVIRHAKVIVSE